MSTTETNAGEPISEVIAPADAPTQPQAKSPGTTPPVPEAAKPRIKIGSQRPGTPVPRIEPRVKPIFRATTPAEKPPQPAPPETTRGLAPAAESPSADAQPPREERAARPEPDEPPLEIKPRKPRFEVAAPSGGRVEKPNLRQELSPELEAELQAALGEGSLDELIADESPATAASENLEPDTRLKGRVLRIHRDNVFVDLGGRNQGLLALHNFATEPEEGAVLDVIVQKFNAEEGLYDLSAPGQTADVADWSDIAEGIIVDAVVTGSNKGGLECTVNKLKGFIPAGQISIYRVENFEEFVGQRWPCVVTEANRERRNLILSRRAMLEREQAEAKKKLLAELEVGQTREGIVRNLRDFGAFVDLGGLDGLIHVSQLSYDRVKHPSEVLTVGQKVNVKIQKIDADTGKIALGYRDMFESPWTNITSKYPTTSVVKGKVSRVMDFGAFVKLEPGVEGLIHISEISHKRVFRVSDVLQEGQDVEAKIMSVDPEQQRIGLSLRALEARPEPAKKPDAEPEPVAKEPVVAAAPKKPRKVPLKGGLGRAGDGASVGLKW